VTANVLTGSIQILEIGDFLWLDGNWKRGSFYRPG